MSVVLFDSELDGSIALSNINPAAFTLLNYRTQNCSLLKPDICIDSSGKLLNYKCTHTASTEKMA
jgi:hypothetical protein